MALQKCGKNVVATVDAPIWWWAMQHGTGFATNRVEFLKTTFSEKGLNIFKQNRHKMLHLPLLAARQLLAWHLLITLFCALRFATAPLPLIAR